MYGIFNLKEEFSLSEGAKRIIFPLDVNTLTKAEQYVTLLAKHVNMFKIGMELFTNIGFPGIKHLNNVLSELRMYRDRSFMLDLKLHDIPMTVYRTVKGFNDEDLGIKFFTVHAAGGKEMIKAAKEAIIYDELKMIAVTVLTSLTNFDLYDINNSINVNINKIVIARAAIAMRHGAYGVVASSLEVPLILNSFKGVTWTDKPVIMTPGIRLPRKSDDDDQRRVGSPYDAIKHGSDYLVIGRLIRDASNPVESAIEIAEIIENALKEING
jgi:orotidine-5'-phosphate decarboxylase